MHRLNQKNLSDIRPDVQVPPYDREAIESGIVHFGVGNFHRTHQAVYCDNLLCQGGTQWGITGVSLRSPSIRDKLAPQDYLYTVLTLGEDSSCRIIGALKNILVAPEDPAEVINTVARNQTKVVSTTITEKGYCLSSGKIDKDHPAILNDLASLERPQTIYGYLAAALIKRASAGGEPLTVICCDNIQGGGEHLKSGVSKLMEKHGTATREWLTQNVAFTSSMVDRVSPATDDQLTRAVASRLGVADEWPVAAEPFSQWIIQDHFAGPRPPFDQVGAQFVEDITPFETMKLRFLNAGHSMIAALGYLAGDRAVHEALSRPAILNFVNQALVRNVLPATQIPAGSDGMVYIQQVLDRFQNSALPYAVLQVGSDSSQKIQQRWFPGIDDALGQGSDASYLAFALAAWVRYIVNAINRDELNDPIKNAFSAIMQRAEGPAVEPFLALADADKFHFFNDPDFLARVKEYHHAISTLGVEAALTKFLETEREN